MPFFTSPTSFRLANPDMVAPASFYSQSGVSPFNDRATPHSSHPDFGHLTLLVFEAVMEVVFVSLPGYIVARQGMFDAEAQKFVANLNVMVFTPCLIFTKLASQLTADKLVELAIIPFIFITQTFVSWACAWVCSKAFGFGKRPSNFVTAMAVFGNSNSLPISLVLSLSKTISGLHWDQVPGDNDNEVAARGILYLLIFQQLGQLVRWTWGYNVLLAPPESYRREEEDLVRDIEEGHNSGGDDEQSASSPTEHGTARNSSQGSGTFHSGERTPTTTQRYTDSVSSKASSTCDGSKAPALLPTPANGNYKPSCDAVVNNENNAMTSFPTIGSSTGSSAEDYAKGIRGRISHLKRSTTSVSLKTSSWFSSKWKPVFESLPTPVQRVINFTSHWTGRFLRGVWEFMNPPLWAMLVAILVASVPSLQFLFFSEGTFINNSITRAVSQSGGVAVPLILVVLGANLARNTLPKEDSQAIEDAKDEKKLLIASILSRMLLPIIVMAPLLAVVAKYVPVSILDDPIFIIVCFLLIGAPSALQLAQICQINNVYMGAMSRLLFQSYVVWILPSTLVLVTCAIEVVEWAQQP